jgi:hypothetical protein
MLYITCDKESNVPVKFDLNGNHALLLLVNHYTQTPKAAQCKHCQNTADLVGPDAFRLTVGRRLFLCLFGLCSRQNCPRLTVTALKRRKSYRDAQML